MSDVHFSFDDVPAFQKLITNSAPKHALRAMGKALHKIGKSDTERMKKELEGGSLNIKSKRFLNSFKFKATDSREVQSISQLKLSEYTGAKPFRIFEDGGEIEPKKSRLLTILTAAARNASGTRKYSQKELSAMISSGQARIIQTKAGPAVVLAQTKTGRDKKGPLVVLAWLKPQVREEKRIDFYGNFEKNTDQHNAILDAAAQEAIEKTEAEWEGEG